MVDASGNTSVTAATNGSAPNETVDPVNVIIDKLIRCVFRVYRRGKVMWYLFYCFEGGVIWIWNRFWSWGIGAKFFVFLFQSTPLLPYFGPLEGRHSVPGPRGPTLLPAARPTFARLLHTCAWRKQTCQAERNQRRTAKKKEAHSHPTENTRICKNDWGSKD